MQIWIWTYWAISHVFKRGNIFFYESAQLYNGAIFSKPLFVIEFFLHCNSCKIKEQVKHIWCYCKLCKLHITISEYAFNENVQKSFFRLAQTLNLLDVNKYI